MATIQALADCEADDVADLTMLAHERLQTVVREAETGTTLDDVLRRLFDPANRAQLTYCAFNSSL
jgi:hypothetical protein